MDSIIVIAVVAAIIGGAVWYIISAKKKGRKCIGCSESGNCRSCGCRSDRA